MILSAVLRVQKWVSHTAGRAQGQGVWEHGTEEDNWA